LKNGREITISVIWFPIITPKKGADLINSGLFRKDWVDRGQLPLVAGQV
jgi:hypothetical protein